MSDGDDIPDAIKRVTFGEALDPLAPEFALSDADKVAVTPLRLVNAGGGWVKAGHWKYRVFGREIQLRSDRLPHLPLDLWRSEVEALFQALGQVLDRPTPLAYRTPWHERLRMWWSRRVWNRRHALELDAARLVLLEETMRSLPQPEDLKAR